MPDDEPRAESSWMSARLPNFLFIGPDKAGSTWLHAVLMTHPQALLPAAKDLYFFDRYYGRGLDWYAGHFSGGTAADLVVAEVCHDYLFSPVAAERILATLPDVRLMVCLREPVARAFSSYLHMLRHGLTDLDFVTALKTIDELLDHGAYARHLEPYQRLFGRDRIYLAVFDDLQADPQRFLDELTDWLGIAHHELSAEEREPRREASRARNVVLARLVKRSALLARDMRLDRLVGKLKSSRHVERLLYTPLKERPEISPEAAAMVQAVLAADLELFDETYGLGLRERWHWPRADDLA
jgi:hypothetical protein